MTIITVAGLKEYYGIKPNIVQALDIVDIEVNKSEFVSIVFLLNQKMLVRVSKKSLGYYFLI